MELLSLTEAAALAGVHRATLYRHMEAGRIGFVYDRGNRKIREAELRRVYGPLRPTVKPVGQVDVQLAVAQERIRFLEALLNEKNARISQLEKTVLLLIKDKP